MITQRHLVTFSASLLTVWGCGTDEDPAREPAQIVDGSNSITLGEVDGPNACADPNTGDEMTVESATVEGDTLTVTVTYGGGCQTHTVTACWINSGCATSDPPQAGLALVHDANADTCKALVTEEFTYDISPLKDCGSDRVIVDLYRYGLAVEYVY